MNRFLCIGLGLFLSLNTTRADDLKNQRLLDLFDRLASESKPRPFSVRRLYKVNDKNQVTELTFRGVKLNEGDLEVLGDLKHVEKVDLSDTNLVDSEMAHLQKLESLRSLNLFQTRISRKGLAHLRMMVQLEVLNIGRTKIDDDSLRVCATLPNLKRLTVHGCAIDGSGMAFLSNLKKLEVIKAGDTNVSDSCVPFLKKISSLAGVQLDSTHVTRNGIKELVAAKKTLAWMLDAESTVADLIERMESGDFQRVNNLTTVGLIIPNQKTYKKIKMSALERNKKDQKLDRQRFQIELRWEVDGRKPTKLRATVAVDRGTVQVHEMGIEDLAK